MHEDDGDGVDAVIARTFKLAPHCIEIGHALDSAVGAHPFVDLDDALIKLFGQDDLFGEDIGPGLVADAQRIAKAAGDQQQYAIALALEQRVGGNGRAHLDLADAAGRNGGAGADAEQLADALDGGVAIGLRVFRKQLQRMQCAGRVASDDVGEGAAAINPEIPSAGHVDPSTRRCALGFRHSCGNARALSRCGRADGLLPFETQCEATESAFAHSCSEWCPRGARWLFEII